MSNKRTRGYVNQDPPQTARSKRQRLNKQGESSTARAAMTSPVCMEVIEDAASTHDTQEEAVYVNSLRRLLVERLKDEEEFERLTMYARDVRFDANAGKPKWELGRLVLDMLHCPMRMNEKVLYMLYFAAVNRCGIKRLWGPLLDELSAKVRVLGSLSPSWSHSTVAKKTTKGAQAEGKLQPFKMAYDVSKKIFNYESLQGLYELIDMALGPLADTKDWRAFIISYLNCLELLTMDRDYQDGEIDKLERRCDKMFTCLITTIGGLESVTNYFHYVGSGHVVCMIRMYGNLWRYRNEGVEAFNNIVSLRHNKFNQQGGARKTCKGMPKQLCPEFWSLGQWLARWSMWNLGYGDAMDPERRREEPSTPPAESVDGGSNLSDCATDVSYRLESCYSCNTSDDDFGSESDESGYNSQDFELSTPFDMSMIDCRNHNLYARSCHRQ